MSTQAEILVTVTQLLHDVIGEEWAGDIDIEMETSFSDDLELESIEFVALAEKMQETFGDSINFAGWLSSLELDAIIGLKVGDVVDFVVRSQS